MMARKRLDNAKHSSSEWSSPVKRRRFYNNDMANGPNATGQLLPILLVRMGSARGCASRQAKDHQTSDFLSYVLKSGCYLWQGRLCAIRTKVTFVQQVSMDNPTNVVCISIAGMCVSKRAPLRQRWRRFARVPHGWLVGFFFSHSLHTFERQTLNRFRAQTPASGPQRGPRCWQCSVNHGDNAGAHVTRREDIFQSWA